MKKITNVISRAGQRTIRLGDQVLVCPFGGRVLGLYPSPDVNVFWTHADLESAGPARALFTGKGWPNTGGMRAWISPEAETCVGDLARFWETHTVPAAMDPADFKVVKAGKGSVILKTRMNLRFLRHECSVPLAVTRTISLCRRPPVRLPPGVSFAGFQLTTILSCTRLPAGVRPGLWAIIQVPGGGEMVIPTSRNPKPRSFIAKPVFARKDECIRCRVRTRTSFKFGLKAGDCRGAMAYVNDAVKPATLLVCRFPVIKAGRYAEYPCDEPSDSGYMQQFYVDDGTFGGFGELEYHSPALARGKASRVADRCEVWAFAGPARLLQSLVKPLVSGR